MTIRTLTAKEIAMRQLMHNKLLRIYNRMKACR